MAAKVLVVEDEATVALTLEAVLASEGYDVSTAGDAAEALERLGSQPFDLALLDLHLGDEDGLQILSRMEDLTPSTSAIVLTGYGSLETAIKAMRSGAADYLLKPCDVGELKAAISRALQRRPARLAVSTEAQPAAPEAEDTPNPYLEIACQEVRTPLTAVIGWAQYAKRRLEAGAIAEARARLDAALQEAWRIAHLIDAFYGVARLGHLEPQPGVEPLDLRAALRIAVAAMHAENSARRYLVSLPDEPMPVDVPPSALATLLTTVIEAAIRSAPEQHDMHISAGRSDRDAIISVRLEAGKGRAEAVVDALAGIEPVCSDGQIAQPGGLGIGLHLARRLSEAHDGRFWAERVDSGGGIAFCLALPLASAC